MNNYLAFLKFVILEQVHDENKENDDFRNSSVQLGFFPQENGCQFEYFKQQMESKEGSVKKLIRIHLNAQKKNFQKRKITSINSKSITNIHTHKMAIKSPQNRLIIDKQKPHKYINLQTTQPRLNLPALNTANFDDYGYKSSKLLLEINSKVKSASEITELFTPREIVNKLKRIKSEQSILTTQKHDFLRKLSSKCKIYVKNPFQRKLSKNADNKSFEQSKILDNQSHLSQSGCQQISKIIAFL